MEHSSQYKGRSVLLSRLLIVAIVLLGFFLRAMYVNWDQGQHLHPDERFLTMVMGNMKVPESISQYLDSDKSTLNPVNVGHTFYVYGTFPLVITKIAAIFLQQDDYQNITLLGRSLSAVADTIGVLFVILIARRLEQRYKLSRNMKYFAGLFYALAVFPIQQSHFFTVDTFANTFLLGSFLMALTADRQHFIRVSILSGAMMGFAVASKINVVLAGPIIGWLLVESFIVEGIKQKKWLKGVFSVLLVSFFWFMSFMIILRLTGPYYFANSSMWNWQLHETFLKNITQLKSFSDPNGYFPPGIQWASKYPIIFPLVNIAFFGLGLPLFFFAIYGFGKLFVFSIKKWKEKIGLLFVLLWMILFFGYQGVQFVTTMRYFFFLYPLLAICAGYGLVEFGKHISHKLSWSHVRHERVVLIACLSCFVWPMMFFSIYLHEHTRIEASNWIYDVLPDKSVVAIEHWDDPLPLNFDGANPDKKVIKGIQLPVFYPDNEEKWTEMSEVFKQVDYYILTSNRGWGSIMDAPKKYPQMSQFYRDLFEGKTEFEQIAEFSSYPSLRYLGLPITVNDDWSEEAFTVYDHPKVIIFAKKK